MGNNSLGSKVMEACRKMTGRAGDQKANEDKVNEYKVNEYKAGADKGIDCKPAEQKPAEDPEGGKEAYPVSCPVTGEVIPLAQVPDTSLAYGMLGPGVGIRPEEGLAVAPFDGEVSALFDTNHAIGLTSDDGGVEVLIHIGINTVELKGQYMTNLVAAGDHVTAGQPLIRFDMEKLKEAGYDTTVAIVVSNLYLFPHIQVMGYGPMEKMDPLLECSK